MELEKLFERTQTIRGTVLPNFKRQLAETAQALDLAAENQARIELLNESLMALVSVLYRTDPDGRPANIDQKTWRIKRPAPWSRKGWKVWGLRFWEGEMLRKIMLVRAEQRRPRCLFDFNQATRTWHLNMTDYPTIDLAFGYLCAHPITLAEWHRHADIYRRKAHERMTAHRSRD